MKHIPDTEKIILSCIYINLPLLGLYQNKQNQEEPGISGVYLLH